jgi:hypothetical protein
MLKIYFYDEAGRTISIFKEEANERQKLSALYRLHLELLEERIKHLMGPYCLRKREEQFTHTKHAQVLDQLRTFTVYNEVDYFRITVISDEGWTFSMRKLGVNRDHSIPWWYFYSDWYWVTMTNSVAA